MVSLKTLHITSGECSANALRRRLPSSDILPFNEAMCEGETCLPIYSNEFCRLRARAYSVTPEEYREKSSIDILKNIGKFECLELYFDYDMFCAVNALTLLAFLEQIKFAGQVFFNLIKQDGSADVLERFPLSFKGYLKNYSEILINKTLCKTGIKVFDKVLPLYIEYKKPDNEIIRYAKEHITLPREKLITDMLGKFFHYGLSDLAAEKFIEEALKNS